MENNCSLAVRAYSWQNLDTPTADNPHYRPEGTAFPGHDTFQNGIVPENQPTTFYTAATDRDIENIKNKNSNFSGFLTDADTVNSSCKNGILDANDFAEKTQTKPWRPSDAPSGTEYTYRPNVAAFDVNWDELNKPENKDFKDKLCNPDGLSPKSSDIKAAYGKAEANTQWGRGGGNQYYIDKDTFNEGVNRGVFQYNEDESFMESKGNLKRSGVSESDMVKMDDLRKENINELLRSCPDKTATSSVDKATSLNEITPTKENKINSDVATKGKYVTSPDPAYNYDQNANVSNNNGVSPKASTSDKVADGGGTRAPNNESTSLAQKSDERGVKPSPDNNSSSNKGTSSERGQKPSSTENTPQSKASERGSKPTDSANNSNNSKPTARGERPTEPSQNASDTKQTQRGTPPDSTGGEDSRAKTSSSSNPSEKISASNNSAKSADEASNVAADRAQGTTSKTRGMGM